MLLVLSVIALSVLKTGSHIGISSVLLNLCKRVNFVLVLFSNSDMIKLVIHGYLC